MKIGYSWIRLWDAWGAATRGYSETKYGVSLKHQARTALLCNETGSGFWTSLVEYRNFSATPQAGWSPGRVRPTLCWSSSPSPCLTLVHSFSLLSRS